MAARAHVVAGLRGGAPEGPGFPVRFVDLDGLYRSSLKFGGCPSTVYVELAESYADRVPKVLVERWSELERLDMRCRKDPRLQRFVLGFIDATGDYDALSRLASLSAACERNAKGLRRTSTGERWRRSAKRTRQVPQGLLAMAGAVEAFITSSSSTVA